MIVRGAERVLVQGITGRQGSFWTERMIAYGTRVVGGVNPKRAGETCCGVPVHEFAPGGDGGDAVRGRGAVHPAARRQGGGARCDRGRLPEARGADRARARCRTRPGCSPPRARRAAR